MYDLTDREKEWLVDGFQAAGEYQVSWNAADMPSGVYFVRMTQTGDQRVERISLVK